MDTLTLHQGEDDSTHFSPENSVSRNQETMCTGLSQIEKKQNIYVQQQKTDNDQGARERKTSCCSSSLVQLTEAVTLTSLQQESTPPPLPPPPPPPPPLSLQSPPSQMKSILAKSTWMMKELIS